MEQLRPFTTYQQAQRHGSALRLEMRRQHRRLSRGVLCRLRGTRHTPRGLARDGSPTPAQNKVFSALDRSKREATSSPRSCFDTLLSALKPYRDVFVENKEVTAPK